MRFEWHIGHSTECGWIQYRQSWQRWNRSTPSRPAFQNGRLRSVIAGNTRNGASLIVVILHFGREIESSSRVRDRLDGQEHAEPRAREHDRPEHLFPRRAHLARELRMPRDPRVIAEDDEAHEANELVRLAVGRAQGVDLA